MSLFVDRRTLEIIMKKIISILIATFSVFGMSVMAQTHMREIYNQDNIDYKNFNRDWVVKSKNFTLSDTGTIESTDFEPVIFYSRPLDKNYEVNIESLNLYHNGGRIFINVCSNEFSRGIKDGYALEWDSATGTKFTFRLCKYENYAVIKQWNEFSFTNNNYANLSLNITYTNGILKFKFINPSSIFYNVEKIFDLYENDASPYTGGYIGFMGGTEYFSLSGFSVKTEQNFILEPVSAILSENVIDYSVRTVNYTDTELGIIAVVLYDAAGKALGTDVVMDHSFEYGKEIVHEGQIAVPDGYIPSHITAYALKSNTDCVLVGEYSD